MLFSQDAIIINQVPENRVGDNSDKLKIEASCVDIEIAKQIEVCLSPPKKKFKKVVGGSLDIVSIGKAHISKTLSSSHSLAEEQIPLEATTLNEENKVQDSLSTLKNTEVDLQDKRKRKNLEKVKKLVEKEQILFEKKERLKLKEEDRRKKEEDRKRKEEDRKRKEEDRKRKEEDRKRKEEDRRKKEEDRRKKEEEKKLKEDEKRKKEECVRIEKEKKEKERKRKEELKKEEEEATRLRKEKAASHFKSFFTKKEFPKKFEEPQFDKWFVLPFQLKPNQSIAPTRRKEEIDVSFLDDCIEKVIPGLPTYLDENASKFKHLKLKSRRSIRQGNEVKNHNCLHNLHNSLVDLSTSLTCQKIDQEIILIDDESSVEDVLNDGICLRQQNSSLAKLLQFSENTRPAYFGTWRKKSKLITGRSPFRKDTEIFDYNIDSDEEWIDEPGEDLDDHIDDEDKEEDETEDDKDGFFVPHGYLSDNEGIQEDSFDEDGFSGIQDKEHLEGFNVKLCSFERELPKKSKPLKPICIGIMFIKYPETVHPLLKDYMNVILFQLEHDKGVIEEHEKKIGPLKPFSESCTPQTVPEEAMPFLLQYIHGSSRRLREMVIEFKQFWRNYSREKNLSVRFDISKRQLTNKIQSVSLRSYNSYLGKICYTVKEIVLQNYKLVDLKLGLGLPPSNELFSSVPVREEMTEQQSFNK